METNLLLCSKKNPKQCSEKQLCTSLLNFINRTALIKVKNRFLQSASNSTTLPEAWILSLFDKVPLITSLAKKIAISIVRILSWRNSSCFSAIYVSRWKKALKRLCDKNYASSCWLQFALVCATTDDLQFACLFFFSKNYRLTLRECHCAVWNTEYTEQRLICLTLKWRHC